MVLWHNHCTFFIRTRKGKPPEKVARKVTDLSLKEIRWQNCRATSKDSSSNPAIKQNNKFKKNF